MGVISIWECVILTELVLLLEKKWQVSVKIKRTYSI